LPGLRYPQSEGIQDKKGSFPISQKQKSRERVGKKKKRAERAFEGNVLGKEESVQGGDMQGESTKGGERGSGTIGPPTSCGGKGTSIIRRMLPNTVIFFHLRKAITFQFSRGGKTPEGKGMKGRKGAARCSNGGKEAPR